MADGIKADFSGWEKAAEALGALKVSLARSIAVGMGEVLRDEAKLQVHTGEASHSKAPGTLKNAIYLAFKDGESNNARVVYSVSWNHKLAPHGHLVEFGHWQPYEVVKLPNGDWFTLKNKPLPSPKWTPAVPFLRPALDAAGGRAVQAGIERGRRRLPELLRGAESGHRSDAENDA